jgi:hypothetical protein
MIIILSMNSRHSPLYRCLTPAARHGILVHTGDTLERLSPRIWAVPVSLVLGVAGNNDRR